MRMDGGGYSKGVGNFVIGLWIVSVGKWVALIFWKDFLKDSQQGGRIFLVYFVKSRYIEFPWWTIEKISGGRGCSLTFVGSKSVKNNRTWFLGVAGV